MYKTDILENSIFKDCPKAEEALTRKQSEKESAERSEWLQMKIQRERWEYLNNKFGGKVVED